MGKDHTHVDVGEKRRFLRLDDYFKVSFHRTDDFGGRVDESADEVGFSKNISLGGVAFVSESPLEPGDVIAASVSIPEIDSPVEFVGEVLRTTPLDEGRWELAVKFLPFGIEEERREQLELFIYDHFLKDPLG